MGKKEPKKEPELRVRSTPAFKLKDRPPRRRGQPIPLKRAFGFIPEVIIVEKVWGRNNVFVVNAVLTPEELKKDKKMRAKAKAELKKKLAKDKKIEAELKSLREQAKKKGGEK